MRRIAIATALLIAGLAGADASAQGVAPNGVVYGQSWNLPQDLSKAQKMQAAQGSGSAADRAARAARQAQFNRNYPGTPSRRPATR
ncbi:hypothetical protein [Sediminicoccus sp. BL-A-41-H5]|uniref:hypothetical protein n=1 Tax=Sediminicoccus sp. BL-A-41-H5 TaxID=3421106 RepID=UPI003D67ADA5